MGDSGAGKKVKSGIITDWDVNWQHIQKQGKQTGVAFTPSATTKTASKSHHSKNSFWKVKAQTNMTRGFSQWSPAQVTLRLKFGWLCQWSPAPTYDVVLGWSWGLVIFFL
jgi:hypothetical protein